MTNCSPVEIRTEYFQNTNLFYVSDDEIECSGSGNCSVTQRGAGGAGISFNEPPRVAVDHPDTAKNFNNNSKNTATFTGRI
jgi:hypothetical protein